MLTLLLPNFIFHYSEDHYYYILSNLSDGAKLGVRGLLHMKKEICNYINKTILRVDFCLSLFQVDIQKSSLHKKMCLDMTFIILSF